MSRSLSIPSLKVEFALPQIHSPIHAAIRFISWNNARQEVEHRGRREMEGGREARGGEATCQNFGREAEAESKWGGLVLHGLSIELTSILSKTVLNAKLNFKYYPSASASVGRDSIHTKHACPPLN